MFYVGALRDRGNNYRLTASFLVHREHLFELTFNWKEFCMLGCRQFAQRVIFQTVGHFSILRGRLGSCDFHFRYVGPM